MIRLLTFYLFSLVHFSSAAFTCVHLCSLCDPIWQVTLLSSVVGFLYAPSAKGWRCIQETHHRANIDKLQRLQNTLARVVTNPADVITLLRYSPICTGCRCGFGSSTRLHWSHSRRWRRNNRSTWQNSSATTRLLDKCDLAAKTFYRIVHQFWTFLSVLFVMPHLQSGIVFLKLLSLI